MRRFHCPVCAAEVSLNDVGCLSCGARLVLDPDSATFADALAPGCANAALIACNWLGPPAGGFCRACALTRLTPPHGMPAAVSAWADTERAKRRLLIELREIGLSVVDRWTDALAGLTFEMWYSTDGSISVGHSDGVIALDVAEADDARRARLREDLAEPYRTMLGHLRHEIAHWFWPILVGADDERRAEARGLFGDETADYEAARQRHYDDGPPADWRETHISAYATMHPWEDWAECFAHYLHLRDGLDTAARHGILIADPTVGEPIDPRRIAADPPPPIDDLIGLWVGLSLAINAINRGMGQPDLYPFVLNPPTRRKLAFIDALVGRTGAGATGPPVTEAAKP